MGQESDTDSVSSAGYVDSNASRSEKVTVRALFDYQAVRDDELTFCKQALITNVEKLEGGW